MFGSTEDLPETPALSISKELLSESSDDTMEEALHALSEPLREVIVLRYYYDKTLAEIAIMLKKSKNKHEKRGLPIGRPSYL
mgnify:CR=1 FL=1